MRTRATIATKAIKAILRGFIFSPTEYGLAYVIGDDKII